MVTDNDVIDNFGGTYEVARLCKLKPPAISQWRVRGIPDYRRQYLQLLKPYAFTERATTLRKQREENKREERAAAEAKARARRENRRWKKASDELKSREANGGA